MICNNIGQMSSIAGKMQFVDLVYFSGNFINSHEFTMEQISQSFHLYSESEMENCFLSQEGYLGALGCLVSE